MKKGSRGIIERALSGACAMGLLLGVCVVPVFGETSVYNITPDSAKNSGWANSMSQSFTATCSQVESLIFFVGEEKPGKIYTAKLKEGPYGPTVWSGSKSATGWAYEEMGFGVHQAVTRGKTYYLELSIMDSTFLPLQWNYYYRNGDKYPWGEMELGGGKDLSAKVAGVNRTDSTYWGMAGEAVYQDMLASKAKQIGMNVDREQVFWRDIQPSPGSFNWSYTDLIVDSAKAHGLRVLLNFFYTPKWASTDPDTLQNPNGWTCNPDSTGDYWSYPPRNLDLAFPSDSNYLWKFAYELANRYKLKGVHDYEVYNEVGYYNGWRYGMWGDTIYYKQRGYGLGPSERARLYVRACQVAYNAIKAADLQATVYTNAVGNMNVPSDCEGITGKQWLEYFYANQGKNYSDVITYHWYLSPDDPSYLGKAKQKFWSQQFISDYDTLRRVMRDAGDGAKPAWADEGGYGAPPPGVSRYPYWSVSRDTQANIAVQAFVTGLGRRENGNGPGLDQVNWYKLYDRVDYPDSSQWFHWAGLCGLTPGFTYKPSAYAYKQMTTKLKNLYFNRRVPRPDSFVSCYEFQIPGPDTTLRTWCLWRDTIARNETLSVRTNVAYLVTRDTIGAADSIPVYPLTDGSGKIVIYQPNMDIVPRYLHEYGAVSRPDVIVDSVWLVPTNPKAGDSLWFYARLKNIGNDSVKFNIVNKVTFQVDGATKATYQATRGLAPAGDINHKDTLTVGNSNPQAPPPKDWQANYGDHLIRAWADSADRFVELNESNNMAYIQRHMAPSGKLIIPATGYNPGYVGGRKFSNVRPVKLSPEGNGSTIPFPDSVRIKNSWEGTWRPWRGYADSYWDTLNTGDEMKWVSAQWKMASGETSATVVDSIVLDETVPNAWISSPAHGATVSGTASIYGQAHDFGAHFRIDTLRYFRDATHHDTIHVSLTPIGEMVPSLLGSWNTRLVPNGWTRDTLVVWDSAGNFKKDSISLRVRNNQTNGGDSWASNFGTLPSAPMNVATDPAGNVYFAETQNSKIRKYSPRKDSLFAFSARRSDSTGLNWAVGMVLKDSTTLYIADGYGHAIKAFDRQGNLLLRFGSFGTNAGQFRQPCGIALDTKGRLWVSDRLNNRIQVFDSTGSFLFQFGSQGQDSGKFNSPTGITITPNGLVWVSDTRNNQIQVFDSLGQYLKTIKAVDSLGLDTPLGICSDRYGDIFIADAHHNRIVELNPFGERIFDFGGLGDSLCQFRTPVGVASSPGAHYLYVADMGNRRVQKFIVIEEDTTGGGPQGGAGVHLPPVNFLGPARPNPTRGEATIEYGLAKESPVTLSIYNVTGQVVKEINQGKQKAGYYSLTWDGRSNLGHKVGAGVYFYRLQAGNWAKTRKMVVIR